MSNSMQKMRALTSTHEFTRRHLEKASPITFLQYHREYLPSKYYFSGSYGSKTELGFHYFLDEKLQKKNMKRVCKRFTRKLSKFCPLSMIGSCDGLLLFRAADPLFSVHLMYLICNPITREIVSLRHPEGCVFGIFFDSFTTEYKLLYFSKSFISNGWCFEYFTLALGSKSGRKLGTCCDLGFSDDTFIIIDKKFMYWRVGSARCMGGIVEFNMENEQLKFLPVPVRECSLQLVARVREMHLVKMETYGLSVCIHCPYLKVIHVCVLKDRTSWSWENMYEVSLDWDVRIYSFLDPSGPDENRQNLDDPSMEIGNYIQSNEILLIWPTSEVFLYNFETKAIKKVLKRRSCKSWQRSLNFYTKSLLSLKDLVHVGDQIRGQSWTWMFL